MYRGIVELKNDTSIIRKNGSFVNKTCYALTALFVKTKMYFCHCNSGNKQKFLVSFFRTQNIPENVCSFGNGTPNTWAPAKNVPV